MGVEEKGSSSGSSSSSLDTTSAKKVIGSGSVDTTVAKKVTSSSSSSLDTTAAKKNGRTSTGHYGCKENGLLDAGFNCRQKTGSTGVFSNIGLDGLIKGVRLWLWRRFPLVGRRRRELR